MLNFSLAERMKYNPESFSTDELIDIAQELEAYREILYSSNTKAETPEELLAYVEALEEQSCQCNNEEHSDYDDLKEFFNDCVESLNQHWPCPEAYDMNLREVITKAISKGDNEEVIE